MSKKRARLSRRSRTKAHTPERAKSTGTPLPVSTGDGSDPEQSTPDRDRGDSLTFRQQSAISTIAAAPSVTQAARTSGIGESTIRRWLEDEDFRDELTRVRQEQADLASKELQGLLTRGVDVLSEAMNDPDIGVRLRATRYAFSFAPQIVDLEKLKTDVQALESASTLDPPGLPRK